MEPTPDGNNARLIEGTTLQTVLAGQQFDVTFTFENNGTATWIQGEYKLGHLNNAPTWGPARIELDYDVIPEASYSFSFSVTAPTEPNVYTFEWQVLWEDHEWFGDTSGRQRVVVVVVPPDTGGLHRNPLTGVISYQGAPIILRGGQFDLFSKDGDMIKALYLKNSTNPVIRAYTGCPIQPDEDEDTEVNEAFWQGDAQDYADLFTKLQDTGNNLLRIWLTNVVNIVNDEPDHLIPFRHEKVGDQVKFDVYNAVRHGAWNMAFWDRLVRFATLAAEKNIILQVALFNYYDLVNANWTQSFWNPNNSINPAIFPAWGDDNLVNPMPPMDIGFAVDRHKFFINSTNALWIVQKALAMQAYVCLYPVADNIIFEVMNEPHNKLPAETYPFNESIVNILLSMYPQPRGLISVNAHFKPKDSEGDSDMDLWKDDENYFSYDKVDLMSYHGLAGYEVDTNSTLCYGVNAPTVDPDSITRRANDQRAEHGTKALMMSTDAVLIKDFKHLFGTIDMSVRDGQITTTLPAGATTNEKKVLSDLGDWAGWVFDEALAPGPVGFLHFQNHSLYETSLDAIAVAYAQARARAGGSWVRRRSNAVAPEVAARILAFFNTVDTPQAIVARVQDNPVYGSSSRRAYGIRHGVAVGILQERAGKPNHQFRYVSEIDAVYGIGTDTWQDILYAFGAEADPSQT